MIYRCSNDDFGHGADVQGPDAIRPNLSRIGRVDHIWLEIDQLWDNINQTCTAFVQTCGGTTTTIMDSLLSEAAYSMCLWSRNCQP